MSITLKVAVTLDQVSGAGIAVALRGDDATRPSGYAEVFATTQGSRLITRFSDWATYDVTLGDVPQHIRSITVYLIHRPVRPGRRTSMTWR